MADFNLPDDIIRNIVVRLPTKQLLRCRCVSTHWNHLISDPSFMKLRSRPQILFLAPPLYLLNENAPLNSPLTTKLDHYPFNKDHNLDVIMLGTFNGLVFFVACEVFDPYSPINSRHIHVYNPFTRASKVVVPDPYSPLHNDDWLAYGSTDDDDLKIIKFRCFMRAKTRLRRRSLNIWNTCDVLDLKTCSWSSSHILVTNIGWVVDHVATFLDGFLYWITSTKIVALHVKKMAISEIKKPAPISYYSGHNSRLGTLHGRLCVAGNPLDAEFHLWIMKEESSWSKVYSFTLGKELSVGPYIRVMSVLDDGRIVMTNYSGHVVVYDLLKHSSKILNLGSSISISYGLARCAAYMETLVSPSDICGV